jgi:hypothetical protein
LLGYFLVREQVYLPDWGAMDKYRKAFFASALVISLRWGLPQIISIVNLKLTGLGTVGTFLIAWWGLYFYLRTESKTAFWFSFVLINLHFWPSLVPNVRKIIYVIKNGDIDRVFGYGSPWAFCNDSVFELVFLVPLTFAFIFGVLAIKNYRKAAKNKKIQAV